jgi:hypothetical protein
VLDSAEIKIQSRVSQFLYPLEQHDQKKNRSYKMWQDGHPGASVAVFCTKFSQGNSKPHRVTVVQHVPLGIAAQ